MAFTSVGLTMQRTSFLVPPVHWTLQVLPKAVLAPHEPVPPVTVGLPAHVKVVVHVGKPDQALVSVHLAVAAVPLKPLWHCVGEMEICERFYMCDSKSITDTTL